MRTVVHFVETYLGRTEVFIHNYVSSHVGWHAIVLCQGSANESEFPANHRIAIRHPTTKRDPAWWLNQAVMNLTGRSLWHRRVEAALREVRPAVIHAHFGQQGWLLLPVTKRLGIPLITSFYGYDMSVLPRLPRWPTRLAQLFRDGDLFLAEGPCMRRKLIALGAPPDKIRIQRIAIHVDRYPAWQPTRTGNPVVLFVGRFTEKKGLPAALEAVREVRRRGQALRFRIVGDGDQREDAKRFVVEHKLTDSVEFLGVKPHNEVITELTRASVFIQPSRTASNGDTEGGAPTILLEAQAVGLPIVTTRHADIPTVAPAGRGIFLSEETDTTQLADNLFQALRRSEGCDPSFVRQHHSIAKEVLNLEQQYWLLADQ